MANILGKYFIQASEDYKLNKHNYDSFADFLIHKYPLSMLEKQEVYDIIDDFIFNKLQPHAGKLSANELDTLLVNLHNNLMDVGAVDEDFNVGEFVGYIFLGNLLTAK